MKLDRTLPALWQLTGADIPALATVTSRAHTVVLDDVETLCASIVVDVSRSDAPYVPTETSDLYEALGFLLGRVCEVLPRYDPTKGRAIHDPWTAGFKGWLHAELTRDLIDQWRSWFGRNGQKRLPLAYLDDVNELRKEGDFGTSNDGRSGRERRTRGALTEDQSDSGHAGGDALRGLLESGDRAVLREVEALGLGTAGRAGGRAARADRGDAEAVWVAERISVAHPVDPPGVPDAIVGEMLDDWNAAEHHQREKRATEIARRRVRLTTFELTALTGVPTQTAKRILDSVRKIAA